MLDVKALFNITYGLYILFARDTRGRDAACVINTVMQVTESPLRLVLSIKKTTDTYETLARSDGHFNLSLLDQSTSLSTIEHFGFKSGRDFNKFENSPIPLEDCCGAYRLNGSANSFIRGKVVSYTDLGSHVLVLADILDAQAQSQSPSLSYQYYQDNIKPKPGRLLDASKTIWHCETCGFEIEMDELPPDYICPWCGHGVDVFVKLELSTDELKNAEKPKEPSPPLRQAEASSVWRCAICAYELEATELPPDYICPLCGEGAEAFSRV